MGSSEEQYSVISASFYITIIPRMLVGYEITDEVWSTKSNHTRISNKREWNNCFIKYQTLNFVYVEVLIVNPCKHRFCILLSIVSKAEFRGQFPYLDKLQDIEFTPWFESQSDYQKFNIQYLVSNNLNCSLFPCEYYNFTTKVGTKYKFMELGTTILVTI